MIEVEIDSVRVSLTNQQRIVILKEKGEERYLPIWIGLYEAEAITIALQKIQVARPQTHDLLKTMIQSLNGQLVQVEITSLSDDVFYATLTLETNGVQSQVDCRPSDALALAARTKVPIYVAESVMHQAGISPEDDIAEGEGQDDNISFNTTDENLDVFENFLQNIPFNEADEEADEDEDADNEDDEWDESADEE
jgi:bifunctional DNase/RNase